MRIADCGICNPMNYQTVEVAAVGQVVTAKLNHPKLFNAFSEAATGELEASVIGTRRTIAEREIHIPQSAFRNPHFFLP